MQDRAGPAGFATWNVNSTGANALNDIALGTLGSTAATTLNVTDDGSATIIWADQGGGQWAKSDDRRCVGHDRHLDDHRR